MQHTRSAIQPAMVEGLQGSLAQTYVLDLIHFLHLSRKTGELHLRRHSPSVEGRAFFMSGSLVHVVANRLEGFPALVEIADWTQGTFSFAENVLSPRRTIEMAVPQALMEAVRVQDERAAQQNLSKERSETMPAQTRSSTDVLEEILKVPGVISAVVIGRDGFMIESAGASSSISIDNLGASLAHAVNGLEEMGAELSVNKFQDLFVEYGRAVIMCRPIGDAIVAVIAPDASKLGIIRHKVKPLVDELGHLF